MTFNQGVPRSSRGWVTKIEARSEKREAEKEKDLNPASGIPHLASKQGEVSERFKELVLKTSDSERGRGFESHPLRQSGGL